MPPTAAAAGGVGIDVGIDVGVLAIAADNMVVARAKAARAAAGGGVGRNSPACMVTVVVTMVSGHVELIQLILDE